ncbi:hypothetical protein V8E54_002868 [Elaphomyces granulatus]
MAEVSGLQEKERQVKFEVLVDGIVQFGSMQKKQEFYIKIDTEPSTIQITDHEVSFLKNVGRGSKYGARSLNQPVKKVEAQNKGRDGGRLCISCHAYGLVNGMMETIEDISWDSGQDPATLMPSLVLVKCDGYRTRELLSIKSY